MERRRNVSYAINRCNDLNVNNVQTKNYCKKIFLKKLHNTGCKKMH